MTSPDPRDTPDLPGTPGSPGTPEPSGTSGAPEPSVASGTPDVPGESDVLGAPDVHNSLDARDGESTDEAELRELLQQAVRDIKPAPDALDHLRRAVPARRQHRRQAMAGSVAALLLVGAAVPALVHAATADGHTSASPASRSDAQTSQPGADGRLHTWDSTAGPGRDGQDRNGNGSGHPSLTNGVHNPSAHATAPSTVAPANAPACSGKQLGNGASKAGSPDAEGRVYGWFRVANVSTSPCTMPPGTGTVQIRLLSSTADPSKITVVNHTAGDPAERLPTTQDAAPLVLAPGQTYEVAYAWVPATTGPGGCAQPTSPPVTSTPTPTPTDTSDASIASGASASGATGTDANATDSDPSDSSTGGSSSDPPPATSQPGDFALVQNSTADGPVVVGPTVEDACAGTVYTTAPMAGTPDVTNQ